MPFAIYKNIDFNEFMGFIIIRYVIIIYIEMIYPLIKHTHARARAHTNRNKQKHTRTWAPPWSSGSVLDRRSLPPVFETRRGHSWSVFHLWLRFITFGGRSAHLAYHVYKCSRKTPIITHTHAHTRTHTHAHTYTQIYIITINIINSIKYRVLSKLG